MSTEGMNKQGNVVISDEVISVIAAIAAKSVEGVNSMQSSITGGFVELLGKKNPSKGVKVTVEDNSVEIDLSISVNYGAKINDVAWEIQGKVKNEVESMTGYEVKAVNISVDGIVMPKEEKEEKAGEKEEK